jgi:hypothetical protein
MQAAGCSTDCFGTPTACSRGVDTTLAQSAAVGTPDQPCSQRGTCISATSTCQCFQVTASSLLTSTCDVCIATSHNIAVADILPGDGIADHLKLLVLIHAQVEMTWPAASQGGHVRAEPPLQGYTGSACEQCEAGFISNEAGACVLEYLLDGRCLIDPDLLACAQSPAAEAAVAGFSPNLLITGIVTGVLLLGSALGVIFWVLRRRILSKRQLLRQCHLQTYTLTCLPRLGGLDDHAQHGIAVGTGMPRSDVYAMNN